MERKKNIADFFYERENSDACIIQVPEVLKHKHETQINLKKTEEGVLRRHIKS